jgi:phosphoenolpyruvate-protein kinase (PTS system EI component)
VKYSINEVLSHGFVMGNVKKDNNTKSNLITSSKEEERQLFLASIDKSLKEIGNMEENSYLTVQKLMISDPLLRENALKYIDEGKSAIDAINLVMDEIIISLENSSSDYLKERTNDILDVTNRLINNLENKKKRNIRKTFILYTNNLLPSYLIKNKDLIIGVIAKKGGYTSHSAILCRSFDIPYVIADIECKDNDIVCIDTRKNKIAVNPCLEDMERYIEEINSSKSFIKKAVSHPGFLFLANVSIGTELNKIIQYDFDGIGLFRTELIFMNTNRPLSFDEQYQIYAKTANHLANKIVVFRTFDVGDDKKISYLNTNHKGFDNYINNKEIFEVQVMAMLASNTHNNIRIMFPMIENNYEFNYLRDWVIKIAEANNYNLPLIGMMLETKSALEHIDDFVNVDFISLGTNDLTSELYHIDRENRMNNFNEYIDDLINKLKPVVDYCKKRDICLSVCGELASVKEVALKFYEIGIRNLSVSTSAIQMLNNCYTEFIDKK